MFSLTRSDRRSKSTDSKALPEDLSRLFRPESVVASNDVFVRYQAYDLRHYRPVTLTIVREISRIHIQKIARSIGILESVGHRNILPILGHGPIHKGKRYYWATPRVTPINWDETLLHQATCSERLESLVRSFLDLLDALSAVRKKGVTHGMIGPEVVFFYNGRFCLTDFALLMPRHTVAGSEIPDGRDISTDLHGMGRLLSEFLLKQIGEQDGTCGNTPRDLENFARQLSQDDPNRRFGSVEAARDALEQIVASTRTGARESVRRTDVAPVGSELMPVLSSVLKTINPRAFSDIVVLHINHCLEDNFTFNQVLLSLVSDLIYVAVPYGGRGMAASLPYTTYHATQENGEYTLWRNQECLNQVCHDFSTAVVSLVSRAFENEILRYIKQGKRLLIIEDGGYHYSVMEGLGDINPELKTNILGAVEQTTSGVVRCAQFLRTHVGSYPVLTVARSLIKMRYEAYFISQRVVEELSLLLQQFNDFLSFRNVLIVGYGIIGRNIAACLRSIDCKVSVIDTDEEICALAAKEGYTTYETPARDFFETTSVVIGATGESSFTYEMLDSFLKGRSSRIYLASASSKRVEFADLIQFMEGGDLARNKIVEKLPGLHDIQRIEIERSQIGLAYHVTCGSLRKSIILVAGGFPVNFYREGTEGLGHSMIDPVYAEMVLLAGRLALRDFQLENRLYLLGGEVIPNLDASEEDLMSVWLKANRLEALAPEGIWKLFRVHPCEAKLRARCVGSAPSTTSPERYRE